MKRKRPTPLARLRAAHGWSTIQVAVAAGVTERVVQRVERLDVAGMRLATLVKVAVGVGRSAADLVPGLVHRASKVPAPPLKASDRPRASKGAEPAVAPAEAVDDDPQNVHRATAEGIAEAARQDAARRPPAPIEPAAPARPIDPPPSDVVETHAGGEFVVGPIDP